MSYELRAITSDEVAPFRSAVAIGFGGDRKPDGDERFLRLMPLERTVAAFDGDVIVGTLGDFDLHLTVPGGAQLPMAGTTMVTVQPTHTRRGILRAMMRRHLDSAVERGEAVAGLWASEPGIYGRFGFGLATEAHNVKIDRRHLLAPARAEDLQVHVLPATQIPDVVAPYWHAIAVSEGHPGFIDRSEERWRDIAEDPEAHRDGGSSSRHIVVRRGDDVVGYMQYRQKSKWDDGTAVGTVSIVCLVASDVDANLALWAHALDVDLFPHVESPNATTDDPLAYVVNNARAVRRSVTDCLYVRILDVPAALGARRYEHDGEIVIRITDTMDYVAGTYRLTVDAGTPTVSRTDDEAQASMDCRELGSLFLGRRCAALYATTGRIQADADAIATLDDLFATTRAPWCSEDF